MKCRWPSSSTFCLSLAMPVCLWVLAARVSAAGGWRDEVVARLAATESPAASWAIQVVALDSGTTLFETNAHRALIPASNAKLFTLALALDRLGGDFRIKTSILARTLPDAGGTLEGDLVAFGRGDPTFFSGLGGGSSEEQLRRLVESIVGAGVRQIRGDLVCDDSYFRSAPYGAGWAWDDLDEPYGASVSALSLNDNVIRLRIAAGAAPGMPAVVRAEPALPSDMELRSRLGTGGTNQPNDIRVERLPGEGRVWVEGRVGAGANTVVMDVTVPSPPRYFGERLHAELLRRGIAVSGSVRAVGWREREVAPLDGTWRELASVLSPPVGELAALMMKPSNNLHAQLLWLQAGAETETHPKDAEAGRPRLATTSDAAQRALADFLGRAGVPSAEVQLIEGAGLARTDLASPAAIVGLLRFMNTHPWANAWRDSLPIGGRDGTLKQRFLDGPARNNVRAKTGSLRSVGALSGYVTTADGQRLAFSILVNNYLGSGAKARIEIDRLAQILAAARVGVGN